MAGRGKYFNRMKALIISCCAIPGLLIIGIARPGPHFVIFAPAPAFAETGQVSSSAAKTAPDLPAASGPSENPDAGQDEEMPKSPTGEEQPTIVDTLHAGISKRIQATATWMDSFFGDRRYQSELNESYIRIRYNEFLEHDALPVIDPDLDLRLVLPQLREKTKLVLSRDREELRDLSAIESEPQNELAADRERNVNAAVHQTFRETASDSLILRAGLQQRGGIPAAVLGTRYRILFPLDVWNFRFIEDIIWRSETGSEWRTTADLERRLPNEMFFRATNEWIWTDTTDSFIYAFKFNVAHAIDNKRAAEYEWVNIFDTKPRNDLREVVLRIRYRQAIWRDWLFFEAAPQYRFPRGRSFQRTPGILFRIDMIFGSYR